MILLKKIILINILKLVLQMEKILIFYLKKLLKNYIIDMLVLC